MPRRVQGPVAGTGPVRSRCPISSALDLLGDKWTLLVVRDLLVFDRHRFADFLEAGEGISTNILAERLERLERAGVIERRRYAAHPPRDEYHPTARGRELLPLLVELVRWGSRNVPGTYQPPPGYLDALPAAGRHTTPDEGKSKPQPSRKRSPGKKR